MLRIAPQWKRHASQHEPTLRYSFGSDTSHSTREPPTTDHAAGGKLSATASAYLKTATRNLKTEAPLKSCKQSHPSVPRLAHPAGPRRCVPAFPLTAPGGTALGSLPREAFHPLGKQEEGRGAAAQREKQPAGTTHRCTPGQAKQHTRSLTRPSGPPAALQFPASGPVGGARGGAAPACRERCSEAVVREGALRPCL